MRELKTRLYQESKKSQSRDASASKQPMKNARKGAKSSFAGNYEDADEREAEAEGAREEEEEEVMNILHNRNNNSGSSGNHRKDGDEGMAKRNRAAVSKAKEEQHLNTMAKRSEMDFKFLSTFFQLSLPVDFNSSCMCFFPSSPLLCPLLHTIFSDGIRNKRKETIFNQSRQS